MNILTDEKQTAYKMNRSTSDILNILETYMRKPDTMRTGKSITLIDLSKAFDRMNRTNLYSILYRKGVPIELIKLIRTTHTNTNLAPKSQNKLGKKKKEPKQDNT